MKKIKLGNSCVFERCKRLVDRHGQDWADEAKYEEVT